MTFKSLINHAPFLRLSLPLIVGIILALKFRIPNNVLAVSMITTFLIAFSFTIFTKLSTLYGLRWIFGISIHLFILTSGIYLTNQKRASFRQTIAINDSTMEFIGIVLDAPEKKTKTAKCFITAYQVRKGKVTENCNETILAYLQNGTKPITLRAGDLLVFRASLKAIESTGNPYEFDYRKYLANEGIHYSTYITQQSWKRIASEQLPALRQWATRMQNKLFAIFVHIGMSSDELGVAASLVAGDKSGLDDEIKQAYISSGTMHILAVSGMHVALLYWVLNLALSILDRNKYTQVVKLLIILTVVWGYALMTGLGGSILRAAIMITFLIAGQAFYRKMTVYNSISASALFLLLTNPLILIDVGFQLSYLAVIGIIVFYPLIYELLDINNRILDNVWALIACTLAAQLFTTPVSVFYFHQFPNLFILSNLLVIPLSTIIMYLALLLIPFSGLDWLGMLLGKVFNSMVWLLNKIVLLIDHQPFALTEGIYPSTMEVLLLYMLICFISFYLVHRRNPSLFFGLTVIILFLTEVLVTNYQRLTSTQLIIFNEKNNTVILFQTGRQNIWFTSNMTERTKTTITRTQHAQHCQNFQTFQIDSLIEKSKKKAIRINNELWIKGNFVQFGQKRILITNNIKTAALTNSPAIDYLYLKKNKIQ